MILVKIELYYFGSKSSDRLNRIALSLRNLFTAVWSCPHRGAATLLCCGAIAMVPTRGTTVIAAHGLHVIYIACSDYLREHRRDASLFHYDSFS